MTTKKRKGLENGAVPTKPTTGQPGVENHVQVGLRAPEPVSIPTVTEDPAIAAGREAQEAAAAWSAYAKAHPTLADEQTPEYKAIKERSEKADDAFADAPVTTAVGALVKMREISEMMMTGQLEDTGLDGRHFKSVVAFLEGFAGAPSVSVDDPAVVALAEYKVAKAADDAISNEDAEAETPEYQATGDRLYAARDVVYDAVPTSMAGMAAKVRFIFDHEERGNDLWPAFDHMANSMLPFLERGTAAPDPVVTLFAKWAIIRDEATALGDSDPKATDDEINRRWEDALRRLDAVEDQIMEIPATSIRGVAIKIRIVSHYVFDTGDFDKRHATPARDIDYVEGAGGKLSADESYVISALLDTERLAGVS